MIAEKPSWIRHEGLQIFSIDVQPDALRVATGGGDHKRNLDQLETLSKKLKAKTLRNEAPQQSIAATRLLAREGLNAEQLARDLKSFELKTTFEDVFPAEATSIEDYLQQECLTTLKGEKQKRNGAVVKWSSRLQGSCLNIQQEKEKSRARASYQFQGAEGILDCRTEEAHH